MNRIKSIGTGRRALAAVVVFAVLAVACSSSEPLDIESLNLAIETDIQAGATFEVAVPATEGVELSVVAAPVGVTATLTDAGESMMLLRVAVDADTPRGAYNLTLLAARDGEDYEVGWPFEVVDPAGATPTSGPVATTQAAMVDELLVVDSPQVGDLFPGLAGSVVSKGPMGNRGALLVHVRSLTRPVRAGPLAPCPRGMHRSQMRCS